MVVRILADIGLNQIARAIEEATTIFAEMCKVQAFAKFLVPLRECINGFKARLIIHAAKVKVDDHMLWIFLRREQIAKAGHATEEEHAMELVDIAHAFVELDLRSGTREVYEYVIHREERMRLTFRGLSIYQNRSHTVDSFGFPLCSMPVTLFPWHIA